MVDVPPADMQGVLFYQLRWRHSKTMHVDKIYKNGTLCKILINSAALR